ncbi:hypothetical protein POTOM_035695 [Populus tomentosa]|uniref:RRM domain-containing protein n=1 Tax=Populus tomentosa TaxID=118781 RepID=A0A8X7YUN2_POPTO|nr:hypothetical protein POTOM_035695 [Populus tomentosa]
MTLSRFLLSKPVLHFHASGKNSLLLSSFLSTNGGTQYLSRVKGVEGGKENEHMEMHLKDLPKVKEVEMKVGGSWNSLKNIFTNFNDRMFRNRRSHKQISRDTTLSAVDSAASEVITTQTGVSKHIAESGGSDNALKSSEIPTDSNSRSKYFNTCNISFTRETPLEDAVNTTASDAMEIHGSLDNIKHDEHDSTIVQAASAIISDDPKEVMLENGKRLLEEATFGTVVESNNNQEEEAGNLVSLADHLFDNAFDTRQNKSAKESASIRKEKCQLEKKTATLVERVNIDGSKLDERPPLSDVSQEDDGLVNLFKMSVSNKTAAETGRVNGDLFTPSISFSNHDGKSLKKEESPFDFEGLYGHIKMLRPVTAQDNAILKSNAESRKTVLKDRAVSTNNKKRSKIKKEQSAKTMTKDEGGNLDIGEKDHIKLEKTPQAPLETSEKDSNQTPLTSLADGDTENKLLLRFLHKDVGDGDIISCFRNCGPISKIEKVSSVKGSNLFDAFLHFETRQGLHKALQKPEVLIKNSNAFIHDTASRISIPNLIGDIDISVALVKHPTRTVRIKQLTDDISSHQLKEALLFCRSGINGFFLGASSSNAYVEFESEEAKERALAKHFLQVSGKQLSIFRVDAPRTTVVRILNINPQCRSNVLTICKSFGKLWRMKLRRDTIADVYFKIDEWPNMLNILNSLNGLEADGSRWVAQPASIFPPIILQALWNHPDERRHVITSMQRFLKKLERPTDTAELNNLAARVCGDSL